jgi:thiopurine S-methyltransferase
MDRAFWETRWNEGRIGFHEGRPNTYLERHADRLAGQPRVLVPMCGKTEDLAFLASRGHDVIGVELIESAVRAFFAEHGITPTVTPLGKLVEYASPPITIYAGDVFEATRDVIGSIDAIYDRAALVALPEQMRRRYVDHLRALAGKGKRVLLVSYEYDQSKMAGPPFSVEEAEVRMLYDGCAIELLSSASDTRIRPDAPPAVEKCFAITL